MGAPIAPNRANSVSEARMNDHINVSIEEVDEWIDRVSECKLLSESEVMTICDKVSCSLRC